jgi:hypothetical protein
MRVLFFLFVLLLSQAAAAVRPWEPRVSVQAIEETVPPQHKNQKITEAFNFALEEGSVLYKQGKYQDAYKALSAAIGFNPTHPGARLQRALVALTLGYLNWNQTLILESCTDVEFVLQNDPDNPQLKFLRKLIQGLQERMQPVPRSLRPKSKEKN